jgi:hypothetical protein
MAKYRVLVPITGLINGEPWPEPGGTVELPEATGDGMAEAGHLEAVGKAAKVEKRPASQAKVEKR